MTTIAPMFQAAIGLTTVGTLATFSFLGFATAVVIAYLWKDWITSTWPKRVCGILLVIPVSLLAYTPALWSHCCVYYWTFSLALSTLAPLYYVGVSLHVLVTICACIFLTCVIIWKCSKMRKESQENHSPGNNEIELAPVVGKSHEPIPFSPITSGDITLEIIPSSPTIYKSKSISTASQPKTEFAGQETQV